MNATTIMRSNFNADGNPNRARLTRPHCFLISANRGEPTHAPSIRQTMAPFLHFYKKNQFTGVKILKRTLQCNSWKNDANHASRGRLP